MKGPRAKVQDFLQRVPGSSPDTIARALHLGEEQVKSHMEALGLEAWIEDVAVVAKLATPTLQQLFEAFRARALSLAEGRAPMRQHDARMSIEEMTDHFAQLCDELGES